MRKWILLPILILIIIPTASATLCEERIVPGIECTMITPTISCPTYNYTIYNETGQKVISGGSMTYMGNEFYNFTFNLSQGNYKILLCYGTSSQIIVEEDAEVLIAVLVLIPLLLAFFFLIGAATLSEKHAPIKIFLFLLGVPLFFASFHFGMLALVKFYDFPELENIIGTTTWWIGWVLFVIITYFIIYLLYLMLESIKAKKKERMEY